MKEPRPTRSSDVEELLDRAEAALVEANGPAPWIKPFTLAEFCGAPQVALETIPDEETLPVVIELGRTMLSGDDAQQLTPGSVVTLEPRDDEPVSLTVHGQTIGHGEVLVMNNKLCVRITRLTTTQHVHESI